MNSLVSIIVVNYNGAEFIAETIESIYSQSYTNWELIVVDNNSSDNSIEILKKYANVKLIQSKENNGFAKGNNIGIRESKGELIALLNNDAVAASDWLEKMVSTLENNEELGSCGCKIVSYYEPDLLDSAGLLINVSGLSRARGRNESISSYDSSDYILIPSGCAAIYKKVALDEVGLFDEDFFCYCEDTDLGFRLQLAGWKCYYVHDAVVHHRYSATAGQYSLFKTYLVERNHYWFVLKNFPLSTLIANPLYTIRVYFEQLLNILKKSGASSEIAANVPMKKLIGTLFKAHKDAWVKFPLMLKKRSEIAEIRKVSSKTTKSWFREYRITIDELFKS